MNQQRLEGRHIRVLSAGRRHGVVDGGGAGDDQQSYGTFVKGPGGIIRPTPGLSLPSAARASTVAAGKASAEAADVEVLPG